MVTQTYLLFEYCCHGNSNLLVICLLFFWPSESPKTTTTVTVYHRPGIRFEHSAFKLPSTWLHVTRWGCAALPAVTLYVKDRLTTCGFRVQLTCSISVVTFSMLKLSGSNFATENTINAHVVCRHLTRS